MCVMSRASRAGRFDPPCFFRVASLMRGQFSLSCRWSSSKSSSVLFELSPDLS